MLSPLALVAGGAALVGTAYQEPTRRGRELAANSTDLAGKLAAAHTTNTNVLRDTIAQQLASKNLAGEMKLVGVSSRDVVNAALGQQAAVTKVNGAMNRYISTGHGVQAANKAFNIEGLRRGFSDLSDSVHNAVVVQQKLEKAARAAMVALYGEQAAQLADSAAAEQGVKDADASTSAYHAWAAQINAAKKAHDKNATAITGNSDAAIANRTAIEGQIDAMRNHVAQLEKDGKGTKAITAYTDGFIGKLEQNAHQLGLNSSQVAAFISKITGIPKSHVTDILIRDQTETKLNTIRDKIANLHDKTITVSVQAQITRAQSQIRGLEYSMGNYSGLAHGGTAGDAMAHVKRAADGVTAGYAGTVSGPGNAWNDMAGLYALANGEEVTSNTRGQASYWRPVLKAINAGMPPAVVVRVAEGIGGQRTQGPTTVINRTFHVEPHIHNPVAVDPVQQVTEAVQHIQAYSGL